MLNRLLVLILMLIATAVRESLLASVVWIILGAYWISRGDK